MLLRLIDDGKTMSVGMTIPMDEGFMIIHTIKNIERAQIQYLDRSASPTEKAVLVCEKTSGKTMAIPFELILMESDTFEKIKHRISSNTDKVKPGLATHEMRVFLAEETVEEISKRYEHTFGVATIKDGKIKQISEETLKDLSDADWKKINKLIKDTKEAKQ